MFSIFFYFKIVFEKCLRNNKKSSTKAFFSATFFLSKLCSRKWFCKHKYYSNKKCFSNPFLNNFFIANLFSRKWFCNHKKCSTKKIVMKFLVQTSFRGNYFAIKKFRPKYLWCKPVFEEMILQTKNFWPKFFKVILLNLY